MFLFWPKRLDWREGRITIICVHCPIRRLFLELYCSSGVQMGLLFTQLTFHCNSILFKSPIFFLKPKQIQLLSLAERARYDATIAGALYKRTSDGAKWQLRWFTLYQVITGKANNTCCSCCFTALCHTIEHYCCTWCALKCPLCPFHLQ